jgi:CubicO group peptidase (beta-lactamase class C family)
MRTRTTGASFLAIPLWSVIAILSGCIALPDQKAAYEYEVPVETDDGWRTASLSDKGMKPGPLVSLMNLLNTREPHLIHSILIAKDGSLVFEEYFEGADLDLLDEDFFRGDSLNLTVRRLTGNDLHSCASVSKSVTSQLIGVSVDRGYVAGTNLTMMSFFPDYGEFRSPAKDQISVHDMLTMTTGLPFDENSYPITDPRNDAFRLYFSRDPVAFVLGRSVAHRPGTTYQYNSGTTVLLGEIIRRSTGQSVPSFAEEHLFSPLGISAYEWAELPEAPGVSHSAGGLYLRPRDMAKIGQLMLQDGVWNGRRILSSDWVHRSVMPEVPLPGQTFALGYGYQWKVGRFGGSNAFWAAGWGGQYIVVLPDIGVVFVQTGGRYGGETMPVTYDEIIVNHILPAIEAGSNAEAATRIGTLGVEE